MFTDEPWADRILPSIGGEPPPVSSRVKVAGTVMAEAHLNSIHLQPPRREDFRSARDLLLGSQGAQTLAGSGVQPPVAAPPTAFQNRPGPALPRSRYELVDRDYTYPLRVGVNTVGRLPDNDVVIHDPYISRRHCAILVHATSGCELHDIASKNGTLLNGRPLSGPTGLKSGDEILMCERRLIFVEKGQVSAGPSDQATHID